MMPPPSVTMLIANCKLSARLIPLLATMKGSESKTMRPLPCGYSATSAPCSFTKLATGAGDTAIPLLVGDAGSTFGSESNSSSSSFEGLCSFADGVRVKLRALANRDGKIFSMFVATNVGCDGATGLTSRVIASKSVGSRSVQGKLVINECTTHSPLGGNNSGGGDRSIITR